MKKIRYKLSSNGIQKIILPLLIIITLFNISTIISANLRSEFSSESLNLSIASTAAIFIDNTQSAYNWVSANESGICSGSGTFSDPYIIQDKIIQGKEGETGIWIQNSNAYFLISNCSISNCGENYKTGGIKLYQIEHGAIRDCDVSDNKGMGVVIENCGISDISNSNISRNAKGGIFINQVDGFWLRYSTFIDNKDHGIEITNSIDCYLFDSFYGKTKSNGLFPLLFGITLKNTHSNIIAGNTIYNCIIGLQLSNSNENRIENNTFSSNSYSIIESNDCVGNSFTNNIDEISGNNTIGISWFILFFLLSSFLGTIFLVKKQIKKKKVI
jgi:parallel beta-helix repeat protein